MGDVDERDFASTTDVMARFEDYHRTIVGYHGTGLNAALRIVNRVEGFRRSRRSFDWLGHGTYFWEYAPKQALRFAETRQRHYRKKKNPTPVDARRANEPLAVVASMIRLGFCFDLLEPENLEYLGRFYSDYRKTMDLADTPLPRNAHQYRRLDCAVFEYAYQMIGATEPNRSVDTTRGGYVPAGGERRLWDAIWLSRDTHIQVCVRNPASILGTWLYYPTSLGVDHVCEALQAAAVDVGPDHPQGGEVAEDDAPGAEA